MKRAMTELPLRVVLDPDADHAVTYDGTRLTVRPDADPRDVGWLLLTLLGRPA